MLVKPFIIFHRIKHLFFSSPTVLPSFLYSKWIDNELSDMWTHVHPWGYFLTSWWTSHHCGTRGLITWKIVGNFTVLLLLSIYAWSVMNQFFYLSNFGDGDLPSCTSITLHHCPLLYISPIQHMEQDGEQDYSPLWSDSSHFSWGVKAPCVYSLRVPRSQVSNKWLTSYVPGWTHLLTFYPLL